MNVYETLKGNVAALPKEHVELMYLYGSHARGQATPISDVDVAVWLEEAMAEDYSLVLEVLDELGEAVAPLLGVERDRVDVKDLNSMPIEAQYRVIRDGKVLWARDRLIKQIYESTALSYYWDWQHHADIYRAAVMRRIKEGRFGSRPQVSLRPSS